MIGLPWTVNAEIVCWPDGELTNAEVLRMAADLVEKDGSTLIAVLNLCASGYQLIVERPKTDSQSVEKETP